MTPSIDVSSVANLVELLGLRRDAHPDRLAYRFQHFSEERPDDLLTYGQLYEEARKVAAALHGLGAQPGERALLLYPPGNEFITAFFGSMMAGLIGIPLFPPRRTLADRRIATVSRNSESEFILSTGELCDVHRADAGVGLLPGESTWIATDRLPGDLLPEEQIHAPERDGILYIQYTSGSTSDPKGVEITGDNILYCLRDLDRLFGHGEEGCTVTWLPHFHDMGLIYGILLPLYWGHPSVQMAPIDFVHRPARWLRAITDFRGTSSAAPNFAYQLCLDEIAPGEASAFNLDSWHAAFIAAEHNRRETMEGFVRRYGPSGFRNGSFCPAWGQAESTLQVTAVPAGEEPAYLSLDKNELANDRLVEVPADAADAVSLVSTGGTREPHEVRIVDTGTFTELGEMEVGEIWVRGPLVCRGYWNNPEKTEQTFRARLGGSGEGPFLRTGDLGFVRDGQVYMTGRLKDVIIIRGMNYYPQDIEYTVHKSHKALRIDKGAAFSIEAGGQERLVVAQEIDRAFRHAFDEEEIFKAVRSAVAREHELQVYQVVLIEPKTLLRTSSGKIQHAAMKAAYLKGGLEIVARSEPLHHPGAGSAPPVASPGPAGQSSLGYEELSQWLRDWCTRRLGVDGDRMNPRESFLEYGMDSISSVTLSADLCELTGRSLSPALAYDYPHIDALARHLSGQSAARELSRQDSGTTDEPVAVIGAGCRFPGAEGTEDFWKLLMEGESAISEVPVERWDASLYFDPELLRPDGMNTRWGGFVEEVEAFDHSFFNISYREACMMDPQQRMLLEVTYQALEDAGLPTGRLEGSATGVFVGVTGSEFHKMLNVPPARGATGVNNSITANRLSYHFDWRGPSMAIDTACSSSLYAVHQACQSLRSGEASLAVAGGVNAVLSPDLGISLSQAGMMASDGRCKSFDARADGYVRSEGCGMVVLKRLSDARRDGDRILALISGSARNQDGRSNGLTAPNGVSQVQVIRQALRNAGLEAAEIDYLEAHGSGTPLGDVIELRSAAEALADDSRKGRCGIGSVKANIGHLESAAGIAGLIKAVLMLRHGTVPPHINYREANPDLRIEESPFAIATLEHRLDLVPRHIGVSSFGFGGANAHVILSAAGEENGKVTVHPAEETRSRVARQAGNGDGSGSRITWPLLLSARSPEALRQKALALLAWLHSNGRYPTGHISRTLAAGRDHFEYRLAGLVRSRAGMEETLAGWTRESVADGEGSPLPSGAHTPRVAFLFPGQGTAWRMAGADLYLRHPVFRDAIDACGRLFGDRLPVPLPHLLYGSVEDSLDLRRTLLVQPALFSLGYALFRYWTALGVRPAAVMGHSLGEITAAAAAEALSLEEAVELVILRAGLMDRLPEGGGMAAVFADPGTVHAVLKEYGELAVAGLNGPRQVVISGPLQQLERAVERFEDDYIMCLPLEVSHAFHSSLMEPAAEPLRRAAASLAFRPPSLPMISNVTGAFFGDHVPGAAYWADHLTRPVRFGEGIAALAGAGVDRFLELGPGDTLISLGRKCLEKAVGNGSPHTVPAWHASLEPGRPGRESSAQVLTELYRAGADLNWDAWFEGGSAEKISLPTYPYRRRRCWPEEHEIESPAKRSARP